MQPEIQRIKSVKHNMTEQHQSSVLAMNTDNSSSWEIFSAASRTALYYNSSSYDTRLPML